jgi:hypothetical protein
VSTAVAEAEACISTVKERQAIRATKFWVNVRTLPATNPLSKLSTRTLKRYTSPLQRFASEHQNTPVARMEIIQPYIMAPWEQRLHAIIQTVEIATDAVQGCTRESRLKVPYIGE